MIRIRSEADWDELGITSPHLRFFYERWSELLDSAAPISNRASIAGAPEILREIEAVRARYGGASYGMGAMRALEEEAFGITKFNFKAIQGTVDGDEIAQALVGPLIIQRENASKLIGGGSTPDGIGEARRAATLRVMSNRLNREYLPALVTSLRTAIFDVLASPENARRLDRLTGMLVTELLATGFAESYLRVHTRILERVAGRDASERERFEYFAARLLRPLESFFVILRVQGRADLWARWPVHLSGPREAPTGLPDGALVSGDWDGFSTEHPSVRFIEISVAARDHHAASRYAAQEFQRHADLAFVGGPQEDPDILSVATLREVPPGKVAVAEPKQVELGSVPIHRTARRDERQLEMIAAALGSSSVGEDAKRRLSGAVRYYRISVGQPWSESGLTNLWTALEVLASEDFGDNIIDRVVRSVTPILASGKVRDLIRDLVGYLLIARVHKDTIYRTDHPYVFEGERLVPHLLLGAVADRNQALALAGPFMQRSPLLVGRIMSISEIFRSGLSLANHVHRTALRIEWHIRRLYRQRNDGVHGAALNQNTTRMLGYLRLYVYETAVIQGRLLAADNSLRSIEDVVAASDAAYQHWLAELLAMQSIAGLGADGWRTLYQPPYEALTA